MLFFASAKFALTSHDISFHQGSSGCYMKILVRRSKTDQRGEGQEVFVHERPKWVLTPELSCSSD